MRAIAVRIVLIGTVIAVCFSSAMTRAAAIDVAAAPFSYSQNFDTLATTGASVAWNDSTLPGWSIYRQPSPGTPLATYTTGNGGSNAGGIYSFGTGTTTDRALGGAGSGGTYFGSPSTGSVAAWWGVAIQNSTGSTLDSFTIGFDGEQWRDGGNTTAQTMVLEYGFGSAFNTVSSWTAPGGNYDFVSPHTAAAGALNGNDAANRTANLGGTITGQTWNAGDTLWIRWVERNDAGNDHGLAVDNFSFSVPTSGGPTLLPGDYNGDATVDAGDYVTWRRAQTDGTVLASNETVSPAVTDSLDYDVWRANFGNVPSAGEGLSNPGITVPEPTCVALMFTALIIAGLSRLGNQRRPSGR